MMNKKDIGKLVAGVVLVGALNGCMKHHTAPACIAPNVPKINADYVNAATAKGPKMPKHHYTPPRSTSTLYKKKN